jgi:uncharacterized membrane protein
MISNHYPMTYSGPYGWLVLAGIAIAGVLVRYFYVQTHFGKMMYALPVIALAIIAGIAYVIAPHSAPVAAAGAGAPVVTFAQANAIVAQRCAVCHAVHPTQAGFSTAPQGILLDTPEHIIANASLIKAQAVDSHAMPLGNITQITDAERKTLGAWIDAGAKGP